MGQRKTKDTLYAHASRRFEERYGEPLSMGRWAAMNTEIVSEGDVDLLMEESNSRHHYLVWGKYVCVYNTKLKGIATFLPPEAIWNYLKEK